MKPVTSVLGLSCLVWALAPRARCGDLERVVLFQSRTPSGGLCCPDPTGLPCGQDSEAWERWPESARNPIPWTILKYHNATYPLGDLAPGLPLCTTRGAYPALVRAADEWNSQGGVLPFPLTKPVLDSSVGFSVTPREVFYAPSMPLISPAAPNLVGFITNASNVGTNGQIFATLGTEHVVLGVTAVHLQPPPPAVELDSVDIIGFDLLLNATTTSQGPAWIWVSEEADGTLHSSEFFQQPVDGFADVEGVCVHEFGHAAGLGHSVVDSEVAQDSSLVPTMYPYAQTESFSGTLVQQVGCSSSGIQGVADPSGTTFGGILGRSARTLEPDDVAAINRGYAQPALDSVYGAIEGSVSLFSTVAGVSVVAVSVSQPDKVRIGTLTYHRFPLTGPKTFRLSGLPPGEYCVFAEPIDLGYIDAFSVPGYVFPTTGVQSPSCLCTNGISCSQCPGPICATPNLGSTFAPTIIREVFNSSDTGDELRQKVSFVTVQAGATTLLGIHLDEQHKLRLEAASFTSPTVFQVRGFTMRAFQFATGTTPGFFNLRVKAAAGEYANKQVEILLSHELAATTDNGQLREVGTPFATLPGTLDAQGDLTTSFTLNPPVDEHRMIFAQARIKKGGVFDYTNPLSIFVGSERPVPILQ